MTSIFIGYIGVMIRGWWKGIVLCVFGFIMLGKMHIYILMANENDYHKCVMIMDVLELSTA